MPGVRAEFQSDMAMWMKLWRKTTGSGFSLHFAPVLG